MGRGSQQDEGGGPLSPQRAQPRPAPGGSRAADGGAREPAAGAQAAAGGRLSGLPPPAQLLHALLPPEVDDSAARLAKRRRLLGLLLPHKVGCSCHAAELPTPALPAHALLSAHQGQTAAWTTKESGPCKGEQ